MVEAAEDAIKAHSHTVEPNFMMTFYMKSRMWVGVGVSETIEVELLESESESDKVS